MSARQLGLDFARFKPISKGRRLHETLYSFAVSDNLKTAYKSLMDKKLVYFTGFGYLQYEKGRKQAVVNFS